MSNLFTVYKSSAGSGKTYTLVKEYLRIVLTQEDVSRYRNILAITFTNKAANEMKERILENLKKLSASKDSKEFDEGLLTDYANDFNLSPVEIQQRSKTVFNSLLHNYSDLKVSTIDKFTHKIIRAFAKDLSLQPDFDIEMDGNTILKSAINEVVASVGKDKEVSSTLTRTLFENISKEKSWNIEGSIFEFSKELIKEENAVFLNQLASLPNESFKKATQKVMQLKKEFEKEIKSSSTGIIDILKGQGIEKDDFSRGTFYNYFNDIGEGKLERLLAPPVAIENAMDPSIDKWLKKDAEKVKGDDLERVKGSIRVKFGEIIGNQSDYFTYNLLSEHIYHMELIKAVYKELNQIKDESGILLIADFNKIIAEQIQDQPAPFIYEKIGERYKNIMIDEFQDTSILQWQNLLPLVDNSLSQGFNNLIVGDAKQAIYRFRGGKVEQFVDLPKIYQHNDDELLLERQHALEFNHNPQNLETNYRSQKEVILFNNWFFNELKEYLPEQYKAIYKESAQLVPLGKEKGYVEVSFIKHKEAEDLNEEYVLKTGEIINQQLQNGYKLKDIAVLVRDNKKSTLVADYLIENNIPVITSESLVIHKNKQVGFVVNFLKLIANPNDNIPKLALVKYLSDPSNLSKTLLNNLIPKGKKNAIAFDNILQSLDKRLDELATLDVSIYDLAEHIIRSFDLNQGQTNPFLLSLLDKIYDLTGKQNDLNYFVNWWEEHGHKISVSTPDNTNAVTVLTVHKSKGLQYPVVIMPFSNWAFKHASNTTLQWIKSPKEIENELPITVIPVKKEIELTPYAGYREIEEQTNKLDNFNLLYVALTRPEQALYVISDTNTITSKKELKTNYISTFLHQICLKHSEFNEEDQELKLGEHIAQAQVEKEEPTNEFQLNTIISSNWRDKVNISEVHKKHWNEGTYQEWIEYGNLIHDILAKMEKKEELDGVLDKMILDGLIKQELIEKVRGEIEQIMQLDQVKEWFNGTGLVKNEKDLITAKGQLLRPDKVILFNHKAIVVDFKTGEPNKSHHKQVKRYGDALRDMNYANVEEYLLYTKHKIVERI